MKWSLQLFYLLYFSQTAWTQEINFDVPEYTRRKEIYPLLQQGDFAVFDRAVQEKEAGLLWFYVTASHGTPEENRIFEYARKSLSMIPGHTQIMIDRIEQHALTTKDIRISADHKYIVGTEIPADTEEQLKVIEDIDMRCRQTVEREFIAMGKLGSPECIQTLMTYLDDDRQIGVRTGGSSGGFYAADSNNRNAVDKLARALGPEFPALDLMTVHGIGMNLSPMCDRLKKWWLSDASKRWRTPVVKTTRSHMLPGVMPETSLLSQIHLEPPSRTALWPILVILSLATLASVFGFAKLRRG